MRIFLLAVHVVFAAGVLYGAAVRPDIVSRPALMLLVILAGVCSGLWLEKRWAAMPAFALAVGTGGTAMMLVTRETGWTNDLVVKVALALFAVTIIEVLTIVHAVRKGRGPGTPG